MKIRNGFVSNSSSASFIVIWSTVDGENMSIDSALGKLFCSSGIFYDDKSDKISVWVGDKWEGDKFIPLLDVKEKIENSEQIFDEDEKIYLEIMKKTKKNDSKFITTFWTSMFNDARDFGPIASAFIMALSANNQDFDFKVKVVED